jgi:hypothetical protein
MRVRMKTYVGRFCKGIPLVYVIQVDGDSRFLRRHSELCDYGHLHQWGRRGPGSLQLAYDLLYDATQDAYVAGCWHEAYQRAFISRLSRAQGWRMSEQAVLKAAVTLTKEKH